MLKIRSSFCNTHHAIVSLIRDSVLAADSGDPGNERKIMQDNYRRDLQKQVEEDRARKQAERQREREVSGTVCEDQARKQAERQREREVSETVCGRYGQRREEK